VQQHYSITEMVGCQKSKCSSSWPLIATFTCIVNMQTGTCICYCQCHDHIAMAIKTKIFRPDLCLHDNNVQNRSQTCCVEFTSQSQNTTKLQENASTFLLRCKRF